MFQKDNRRLPTPPADGMQVFVFARPTLWEEKGEFRLTVLDLLSTEAGGLWQVAFEKAKAALAKDGLLDPARKRRLPRYPRRIAVVTSPDGAALRDIIAVATRRWPVAELLVVPTRVQGDGAEAEIRGALALVTRLEALDLVIIGRGGGSREDLWTFNHERIARAVAALPVPVISAVGHETDVTLCDLVADLRAPTPSAAAEAATPDVVEVLVDLDHLGARLACSGSGGRGRAAGPRCGCGRRGSGAWRRRSTPSSNSLRAASRRGSSVCARRATASPPPRHRSNRSSPIRRAMSGSKTSTIDRAVEAYLTHARARVDAVLESWGVRAGEWWHAPVTAAMRYSLLSTGKRLRPTLVFAAAESVGGRSECVAELAAAVEVVHAYSLVHDDPPCMDHDDLRRRRPTTHRAFDVPTAVVAGYHRVALGARVLDAGLAALAPEARRGIALELFRAAGAGGMIGGQALDLEAEGRRPPAAELEDVHRRKTGALISAACVIGA